MRASILLVLPLFVGCYSASEWDEALGIDAIDRAEDLASDQHRQQWTDRDDPRLFSDDLDYTLASLPLTGEADEVPWAASYWPVYEDSINHKWDGADSQSPSAKYGAAFGIDDMENKVSATNGVDAHSSRTECTTDDQCNDDIGESCAIREGAEAGRCIPTWWGICHAWAPAAIEEPEPIHPVTRNGVTFEVNDIKALLTISWDASNSKFVSLRCDEDGDDLNYDGYSRPSGSDAECADTNPGTYHVLLANYLGKQGLSFVEDRTFDAEVWNQPLRGYRITQQTEIDAAAANALVGYAANPGDTPAEPVAAEFSGTVAKDAWHHAEAVDVPAGHKAVVTMSGSADADLYTRIDQQPTDNKWNCRPYQNGSQEACTAEFGQDSKIFVSIKGYATSSDFSVKTEVLPMDINVEQYAFNDEAAAFFHVKLEVDYITEAASSLDGNLKDRIDEFTRTDRYEYVLEVDADGKINGGEWIGESKQNHPDFLWLPTGRNESKPIAGGAIDYAIVQELLDASVGGEDSGTEEPTGTQLISVQESGSVAKDEWNQFGPFEVVEGSFRAEITGTGDADLYVRRNAAPTTTEHDCRPYKNGSAETCELEGAATYYVGIRGYTNSTYNLNVSYTGAGTATPTEPTEPTEPEVPAFEHLNIDSSVASGAWKRYSVTMTAGQKLIVGTEAANDIDLYVRWGSQPTESSYDQRPYTASGNETVEVTAPADGVLHIGVHGYEASAFTLVTTDA